MAWGTCKLRKVLTQLELLRLTGPKRFVPALALIALLGGAPLGASPAVIVTVDVETTKGLPLPSQANAQCANGEDCGLNRITRVLRERGLRATFFLNVYEYKKWGEPALRGIANQLQAGGHDVELHTHPQWAYDPGRPLMYTYSPAEQTRIIDDGIRLLEAWTGQPVLAHRGGAYSADKDTIDILAKRGVVIDSSLFLGHPYSQLNGLGLADNLPSNVGSVVEIPVTVYWRDEHPTFLAELIPPLSAIRKFDVNSFSDEDEAASAMNAAVDARLPYVVVFLHSFSFIDGTGTVPTSDAKAERVFERILDFAKQHDLRVVTMRELAAAPGAIARGAVDIVPHVEISVPLYRYVEHSTHAAVNRFGVGRSLALGIALLGASAAVAWTIFRRRRRAVPSDGSANSK